MIKELTQSIHAKITKFSLLTKQEQTLLEQANKVRENAQAPYSNFSVGVAILSKTGNIFTGCNVERCSWSQTTHAEQNAIDSMIAQQGPSKIEIVAVVAAPTGLTLTADHSDNQILSSFENAPVPCGHCRQIIWENCFNDKSVKIISLMQHGDVLVTTIGDSLPLPFGPESLRIDYNTR